MDAYGALGNAAVHDMTGLTSSAPVAVDTSGVLARTVTAISAGEQFTCAIADSRAYCWGENTYGMLGMGGPATPLRTRTARFRSG